MAHFVEFLKKLEVRDNRDQEIWDKVVRSCEGEFAEREPELFWYLASGWDWSSILSITKLARQNPRYPLVDFFIMTDYLQMDELIREIYNGRACRSEIPNVTVSEIIPLWYRPAGSDSSLDDAPSVFPEPEENVNLGFLKGFYAGFPSRFCDFCYAKITICAGADRVEMPVLLSPLEYVFARENVFLPEHILFSYLCSVCDGCGVGGAYQCAAANYRDFLNVLDPQRGYWICDHIERRIRPRSLSRNLSELCNLPNWESNYGQSKIYEVKDIQGQLKAHRYLEHWLKSGPQGLRKITRLRWSGFE